MQYNVLYTAYTLSRIYFFDLFFCTHYAFWFCFLFFVSNSINISFSFFTFPRID